MEPILSTPKGIRIAILVILIIVIGLAGYLLLSRESLTPPSSLEPEAGECIINGCNQEICGEEQIVSTCEFRPEYSCFKYARCQRQPNGECGWTITQKAKSCLEEIQKQSEFQMKEEVSGSNSFSNIDRTDLEKEVEDQGIEIQSENQN